MKFCFLNLLLCLLPLGIWATSMKKIQNELLIDQRSKRCMRVAILSFLTPALGINHSGWKARDSHCKSMPPTSSPLTEPSIPLSFKEKGVCVCVVLALRMERKNLFWGLSKNAFQGDPYFISWSQKADV